MKKIFTILSVSAAMLMSAQELLTNPGFETGVLSPWAKGPSTSYTEPTINNTGANSGTYSVSYVASATTGFYQEVAVTAGTVYTASFWYKATGDGTDARIWSVFKDASATIIYLAGDSSTTATGSQLDPLRGPYNGYLPTSDVWTQHTITFTAPANSTLFQFAVRAYNGGTVNYDDFSLTVGSLATVDLSKSKFSLVKNTIVNENIIFGKSSDIQIINTVGQVVKSAKVSEGTSLNVSSLAKGVYIVTGSVNGERVSQKIIKQ